MSITIQDVRDRLKELLSKADARDQSARGEAFQEFLGWFIQNYEDMDDDVKSRSDQARQFIRQHFAEWAKRENLPKATKLIEFIESQSWEVP